MLIPHWPTVDRVARSGVAKNFNWGPSSPFFLLSLPFLPFPFYFSLLFRALPFSPPSRSLEVRPPNIQLGGLGSAVSSPSRVWGGALAQIEIGAFLL